MLTDAEGHPIGDDQNTLKQGARGPALIVDWWGDVMGKAPTDIVRETLSKHWPMPFSRLAEKVVEALAPTHQIGTFVSNMRAAGATGPLVVVEDGDRTYVMELDKYLAR